MGKCFCGTVCFPSPPRLVPSAAPSAGWKWACHKKLCELCLSISVFRVDAGFHGVWKLPKGPDWLCPENPGSIISKSSCNPSRDYILSRTCLSLDICWIICASGRLPGPAGVIFHISPTLNQTQCCADPPPSLKCNYRCMMEPCYTFLTSYLLPFHYLCPLWLCNILHLILEQSRRTHKKCCSLAVNEPKGRSAPQCTVQFCYPCCLGTYWNAVISCTWCSLSHPVYGKSMQYSQIWTLENISRPVYMDTVSWFLSHSLLVLISPVFTRNKSLILWLAFKLSLSCS